MRLENTHRFTPRAFVTLMLSATLFNCSSTDAPGSLPAGGGSGGAANSAGSAGTVASMGGSAAGMAAAGAPAAGGTPAAGGAGQAGASAGQGGAGGAPTSAGAGGASAGQGGAGGAGGAQGGSTGTCPVVNDFATWPSGKGPLDIGKLAVNNFKSHTGDAYGGAGYAWTFAYTGALQFTKLTGDSATNGTLITGFERYASGSTAAPPNGPTASVDDRAFGVLPLEIYVENQDARSLKLGVDRADTQWASTTSDGISKDARYWADDMFMITALQVYASRAVKLQDATKAATYLNHAALAMKAYLAALQQADGNFWHTKQSKAYWGRANGWIAAGMTELLLDLPAGADRTTILAGYKKQMDGLLPLQVTSGADAGMWRQVLDLASSNPESSCTAMFTFALITGIKNGWLTDAKYVTAARNGWTALGNKTNSSGVLDKVCPGTGQADAGSLSQQQNFYASIALGSNDQHGQAPLLWAARALLRTDCPGVR